MTKTYLNNLFFFVTLSSVSAVACASPIINFVGEVTSQTCSVSFNHSSDPYVILPPVTVLDFSPNTAGGTAGATNFDITASGCSAQATGVEQDVQIKMLGYNVDLPTGVLKNTLTDANATDSIGFQISDGANKIVFNGKPVPVTLGKLNDKTTTAMAFSRTLTVKYYALQAPAVGKVQGSMQYELTYP